MPDLHSTLPFGPHPVERAPSGDDLVGDAARRAIVGGVVGLGVLGLAAATRSPLSSRTASAALLTEPVAGPSRTTQAAPSSAATSTRASGSVAPGAQASASSLPSAGSALTPAGAVPATHDVSTHTSHAVATHADPARPAPARSARARSAPAAQPARRRVGPPDAPPAQAAARVAPRVAAARSAAERYAAAATADAQASGARAAAVVASSPQVASVGVPGPVVLVARDAASVRVAATSRFGSGYAAVAATVRPTKPGIFTTDPVLHLARRATFGPRPSDLVDLRTLGIDAWLSRQLAPETIPDSVADQAWALFPYAGASADAIHAGLPQYSWDPEWMTAQATLARQIFSQRQLYEQVVDVMANHLHVAVPCEAWDTAPSYITQVIRPYAMGRYRDLLLAAMRHPAMMQYLNNDVSSKALVNENLGRELLELHTVGSGYTEAEVVASAKVLTGRMVDHGHFVYRPQYHWTGPLRVMGWSSANATADGGLAVGDDYLTYLAGHPSTARTIARKLAVRFVSDSPPTTLVDRMAAAYLANDTDLRAVLDCLFRSPEFWASTGQKTRRPLEDVVGAARVLDLRPGPGTRPVIETLYWVVRSNGQAPLGWDPPNGYPDVAAAWTNAGSLVNRWSMHRALVNNWWQGMTYTSMVDAVPWQGLTAGQWVDALSVRLLGQTMTPARRDAVVAVANGIGPSAPAIQASWWAWTLIPLILDSPYFQLR